MLVVVQGGRGSGQGGRSGSSSGGGRRRPPMPRPQRYDKDKFLQANFRFLISGACALQPWQVGQCAGSCGGPGSVPAYLRHNIPALFVQFTMFFSALRFHSRDVVATAADAVDVRQFESNADRMFDWDDVIQVGHGYMQTNFDGVSVACSTVQQVLMVMEHRHLQRLSPALHSVCLVPDSTPAGTCFSAHRSSKLAQAHDQSAQLLQQQAFITSLVFQPAECGWSWIDCASCT